MNNMKILSVGYTIHPSRRVFVTVIITFVLLFCMCFETAKADDTTEKPQISETLNTLSTSLPAFSRNTHTYNKTTIAYFDYYKLRVPNVRHSFGGVEVAGTEIAVHIFEPGQPRGTVVVAHGYFDHAGIWNHAISYFLEESFSVLIFDFPGHGLSGGATADIEDFSQYLEVLSYFQGYAHKNLAKPVHLVGHSMGAGIITELVLKKGLEPGSCAVLIAPNIRSAKWRLSRVANAIVRPFVDAIPRIHRSSSHNEEFMEFREHSDPLQAEKMPLRWFRQLVKWSKAMQSLEPRSSSVRVIQGTDDGTTNWRYNLPFLEEKLPGLDVVKIEGGEHHLINEVPKFRKETFQYITDYLLEQH